MMWGPVVCDTSAVQHGNYVLNDKSSAEKSANWFGRHYCIGWRRAEDTVAVHGNFRAADTLMYIVPKIQILSKKFVWYHPELYLSITGKKSIWNRNIEHFFSFEVEFLLLLFFLEIWLHLTVISKNKHKF